MEQDWEPGWLFREIVAARSRFQTDTLGREIASGKSDRARKRTGRDVAHNEARRLRRAAELKAGAAGGTRILYGREVDDGG